jgi:acetyl esterase/lipase
MKSFALLVFLIFSTPFFAQDTIMPLWPVDKIPDRIASHEKEMKSKKGILRISRVQEPTIEVYLPEKKQANGKAVLIFPGGGYEILAYDWEGTDVAQVLVKEGIAAIVVKYRLPSSVSQKVRYNAPLMDAQRAIRLVRANAFDFSIRPNLIGVLGFSAGGHLASTLTTHFDAELHDKVDKIDGLSARPDFMALAYPIITFDESITHMGSRRKLLGENDQPRLVEFFSNEKHVTQETPPTFIIHAIDDEAVSVENSLLFYKALRENYISTEIHLYPEGGHGFSLQSKNPRLRKWPNLMIDWIKSL